MHPTSNKLLALHTINSNQKVGIFALYTWFHDFYGVFSEVPTKKACATYQNHI